MKRRKECNINIIAIKSITVQVKAMAGVRTFQSSTDDDLARRTGKCLSRVRPLEAC